MNVGSRMPWPTEEQSAADTPAERGVDRRSLLRRTASGLLLAASGLFLPDWLEEAEARAGALGGARGGRRGKNHRGRNNHKKRNRARNKNKKKHKVKDKPLPFRPTAITVVNNLGEPLPCHFYVARKKPGDNFEPFSSTISQTIETGGSYRYDSLDEWRVGVLIRQLNNGQDIFCDMRNIATWYPRGGVTTGVNLNPPSGNVGAAYIPEANFAQGEEKFAQRAILKRLDDDSKGARRIEWQLTVR